MRTILHILRARWREGLQFTLSFRLLEGLLLAPAAGWIADLLTGKAFIDSTDLVRVALSPRGLAALMVWLTAVVGLRLVEQTGLSIIALGAVHDLRVSARDALRRVLREMPGILRLAMRLVGFGAIPAAPVLGVAGSFAGRLLARHDINYYLAHRPQEFLVALGTIGITAGVVAVAAGALLVRWRLAVPVLARGPRPAAEALSESSRLVAGYRWSMAALCLGTLGFSAGLGVLASLLGEGFTTVVLRWTGEGLHSVVPLYGTLFLMRGVIAAVVTVAGVWTEATVFAWFHEQRLQATTSGDRPVPLPAAFGTDAATRRSPAWGRLLPWGAAVAIVGLQVSGMMLAAGSLAVDRPTAVTAHRGGTVNSPENTLAAVTEAIEVGADYAEIDVQVSKDGVLVVAHDSDFSRFGGPARKVWDLTYEEIRGITVGRTRGLNPRDEHPPRLEEVLDLARGRIRLNIELKYYGDHQRGLAGQVVEAVKAHRMAEQVIIQSLNHAPLQEVRRLAPGIPIGYLFSVNARRPARLDVDFLSVEMGRVRPSLIREAHSRGQEVHVWTLNTEPDLVRMLDLGVDNLITDRVELAVRLARERSDLGGADRALRRIRAWLK